MITAVANHNNSLMSNGFYYGSYETLPPLSNPLCVPMKERQEIIIARIIYLLTGAGEKGRNIYVPMPEYKKYSPPGS